MKKKLLCSVLALVMVLALLAGCGSTSTGSAGQTSTDSGSSTTAASGGSDSAPAAGAGKKIAFSVPSLGNDFMVAVSGAMQAALEERGCTLQIDSADGDVTKQSDQIENYASMGFDALVIWPVNAQGLSSVVKRVEEQGIQVLGFTNPIEGATASMVSADDYGMGVSEAEMANDWLKTAYPDAADGSVKVLFIASNATPEAVQRSDGIQTLTEMNPAVSPLVEIIDWNDSNAARNTTENALLVNPDIKLICAVNGTSAVAANSYVMSAASPVDDKAGFAVFAVDDTQEIDDNIRASANNESCLRGTVSMGSIADTVNDFMKAMNPFIDGGKIETVNGSAFKITPESLS
ncbi:MAG: sugar ABC transporter substrate-binding protein [Oscillospiraceae bacterium]|nr:sugar ABC transporter substrate-binding protein [Oscillospiraceae bacterium]